LFAILQISERLQKKMLPFAPSRTKALHRATTQSCWGDIAEKGKEGTFVTIFISHE